MAKGVSNDELRKHGIAGPFLTAVRSFRFDSVEELRGHIVASVGRGDLHKAKGFGPMVCRIAMAWVNGVIVDELHIHRDGQLLDRLSTRRTP